MTFVVPSSDAVPASGGLVLKCVLLQVRAMWSEVSSSEFTEVSRVTLCSIAVVLPG